MELYLIVVLCGCETWSLKLKEGRRVLWNILGLNRTGLQETGGNHIMRSIMMCHHHHLALQPFVGFCLLSQVSPSSSVLSYFLPVFYFQFF